MHTADHLKIRLVSELQEGWMDPYLGVMAEGSKAWLRAAFAMMALLSAVGGVPVYAQESADDAAGREYFERGRAAFDEADYETALVYFRHAYRLSRRGELQYNIGVAADRLQREEEALEAFRHYLEETEEPLREPEVRERIEALERTIAERNATKLALEEAAMQPRTTVDPTDEARVPTSAIIGGSALAALGVAGLAAMGAGLSKNGTCRQEVGGQCVVERSATAWTWVYGGLGAAALAGSATWFGVSARRQKRKRETRVSIGPTGVMVSGKF